MKVLRYKYERKDIEEFQWNSTHFDWVDLNDVNLMVGKNASGKSTLAALLANYSIIFLPSSTISMADLSIHLENDNGEIFVYDYEGGVDGIKSEMLWKNGKLLMERSHSETKIFSTVKENFEKINPPVDKPVIQVRRDAKEYPFLEELAHWAEGIHFFKFGDVHPYSGKNPTTEQGYNSEDFNKALESLDDNDKKQIIEEFNSLGYEVKAIDIQKEGVRNLILIKEGSLKYNLWQNVLSQGMFRSLSLLIYVHYIIRKEKSKLIIIDDLCEGLDFDRAANLGKIIFNKMKNNNVQFVATSNDFFLMNVVDINYWNIIKRDKGIINVFNYKNSKEKFDKFKYTGLNNFQLFASNYLESGIL